MFYLILFILFQDFVCFIFRNFGIIFLFLLLFLFFFPKDLSYFIYFYIRNTIYMWIYHCSKCILNVYVLETYTRKIFSVVLQLYNSDAFITNLKIAITEVLAHYYFISFYFCFSLLNLTIKGNIFPLCGDARAKMKHLSEGYEWTIQIAIQESNM